ncbi:3-deoxy-D-manno-octulosonic acid transferase [Henriciella pelagia]|jgi:3-deoxy-D-manno-octulosonic-acid transferase|uniref:3-deoxy-D-manno-octulosonic acid transferase n=1 Tax=Henriciella pelagia TaxID=1977912 RepID=A0ABQ1J5E5_9PROT|nr:glycosyltransferase N-terminal domain-containing protein [Henriciella pelagia]GGB60305.1 3-deoxy-D-manno-octulosonic acid transferase [Henriciella pelagia]
MSLGRTLYRTATRAVHPFLGLLISHRVRTGKEDGERTAERFAKFDAKPGPGPVIWMHGASIGETRLLLALAEALHEKRPEFSFLCTSQTRTSAQLVAKSIENSTALKDRAIHQFAPIDAPSIARRFVAHWQPAAAVFAEGEVWANLLTELHTANIPTALVNARMTERSIAGWQKWPGFARELFGKFDVILAADAKTASGLATLGAQSVLEPGNLKSSLPAPTFDPDALARLQSQFKGMRQCLAAISTHSEEEAFVLDAMDRMPERPFCVIVPRHPERAPDIIALLEQRGFTYHQRSTGKPPSGPVDVLLADTLGEVGLFAALADTVYLGGGHAGGIGGHNPIEILQTGTPVLTGPDLFNFQDIAAELSGKGGFDIVEAPQDLADNFPAAQPTDDMRAFLNERTRKPMDETVAALLNILPAAKS